MNLKKMTIGLGAGALMLGSAFGLGSIASADETQPASATSSATGGQGNGSGSQGNGSGETNRMQGQGRSADQRGPRAGGGYGSQQHLAELAKALGVSEDALKTAQEKVRTDLGAPTERGRDRSQADIDARHAQEAKILAAELNLDEAKVLETLKTVAANRQATQQADRAANLKERLDAAVKDGKLTQAQADAVTAAHDAGVLGGHGRNR